MNETTTPSGPPVAVKRFVRPAGHRCGASSTIYEALSFGTGRLDEHGFWEHGCYECARAHESQFPEDGICWPHSVQTLEEWRERDRANTLMSEKAREQ